MVIKKNIGFNDRLLRLALGAFLLALAYHFGSVLLVLGALFCFFQAFMSWCVYYQLIGKNSCPL